MFKNKKILLLVIVLLIIVLSGITVLCLKGMNYGLMYGENTTIHTQIEADFASNEIESIAKEVFGNSVNIRTVNTSNQEVLVTVKKVSDEQLNAFAAKLNEKYSLELTTEDFVILNNPTINGVDLVFPYISSIVSIIIIVLIYFIIRYKKIGLLKVIITTLATLLGTQVLYVSIYALTRLPINNLTMPISLAILILSIILTLEIFDKNIKTSKKSQK